ncbi:Os03g0161900, partial [Oryza sativa Japonica Group]
CQARRILFLDWSRLGGDDGEDDAGDGEGGVAAELAGGGGGAEAHGGAARGRAAAVPDQDVRPGGRPGHRRRRLVGPRGQQLRRLGPPRLRRRLPPTLLQAQQFLQLRPPAQHLRESPQFPLPPLVLFPACLQLLGNCVFCFLVLDVVVQFLVRTNYLNKRSHFYSLRFQVGLLDN